MKDKISALLKCFVIKAQNSDEILLNSSAINLFIDDKNHLASSIEVGNFTNNLSGLEPEYEISGAIDSIFSKERMSADFFNYARIDYFIYDIFSKTKSRILKRGFVDKIHYDENQFFFKLIPLCNHLLTRKINKVYLPTCRAEFGDHDCTIDIKLHRLNTKCDKSPECCKNFKNIINFRGEPFIPAKVIYPIKK